MASKGTPVPTTRTSASVSLIRISIQNSGTASHTHLSAPSGSSVGASKSANLSRGTSNASRPSNFTLVLGTMVFANEPVHARTSLFITNQKDQPMDFCHVTSPNQNDQPIDYRHV